MNGAGSDETEERLSGVNSVRIIDSLPLAAIVTRPADLSILHVNPAFEKLTGFALIESKGSTAPYPWWPRDRHQEYMAEIQLIKAGGHHKADWLFRKKNGQDFWIRVAVNPVRDGDRVLFLIANWVDITDFKQADFNPQLERENPERLKQTDGRYYSIGGLKDLESLRIVEFLVEAEAIFKERAGNRKIRYNLSESLPRIMVDKNKMIEALADLIDMVSRYAPDTANLQVMCKFAGDKLKVSIFFDSDLDRSDRPTADFISGAAGNARDNPDLAIAHTIIEAYGGKLWLESSPGGIFSGVNFTLPVVLEA
jgi:PAS domain S-box-containing protein